MKINWEEHDNSGRDKKFKIDGSVDLSGVVMNDSTPVWVTTFENTPPTVGVYDITGGNGKENSIVLNFTKKPNWFHRTCTRFFLGWKWNDKK